MTDLILVVCEQPEEETPRGALKDWLMEAGKWDWETVNSLVCQFPKSDGLRLLAADFLVGDGQARSATGRGRFSPARPTTCHRGRVRRAAVRAKDVGVCEVEELVTRGR